MKKSEFKKVKEAWKSYKTTDSVSVLSENVNDEAFLGGYDASQNNEENTNARAAYKKWCALRPGVGCPDVAREFLSGWKDGTSGIEEGKWDYDKNIKGKGGKRGAPIDSAGNTDSGAKNRKSRKAFRKAEKAKAHQARMRGEVEEGIAGDAAKDVYRKATGRVTDKAGLERMVNIYVEQAISHLELGLQMRNENDPEILVKTIGSVRKDLIELQKWIRNRNK